MTLLRTAAAAALLSLALTACTGGEDAPAAPEAEATAEAHEAPAAPAAPAGPTCEAFSKKLVSLLSSQGEDAFFKEADVPDMTKACGDAKTLETHADGVKCIMDASDFAGAEKCDLDGMLKAWM
ncbi:MAG: hypothetical protein H6741_16700 [Alphaproteobacteria bacterium]|nr:hypothetical protein [Alphaproteobacteria bacterium]MCB9794355.1 hypothetical protein [Alphaproteobacteria bacterium]